MENKIPDFQKIMLPVLNYLQDEKPHALSILMHAIANNFNLTDDDLRVKVPSGQMGLFKNRMAWAISYLKNAGLVFYPQRGVYQITQEGKKVLAENPAIINIAFLKKLDGYKKWLDTFSKSEEANKTDTDISQGKTPEEILGDTSKRLENKLSIDLLEILKSKPAEFFEYFVLALLNGMGYGGVEDGNFEITGKSGDNGIDGIIYQDKLGIDRIYVQAKRWRDNKVQSKDIRDFIGSLSLKGTNKGIFITTSEFTDEAVKTANMNPQNRIILMDGFQLAAHAIENNIGVQVKKIYEVKDIDNDFFEEI